MSLNCEILPEINKYYSKEKSLWKDIKRYKFIYFLVAPAVIITFVFAYIPMLGLIMAFEKFDIFKGFFGSPFVGFDNFKMLFDSPQLANAVFNTLLYGAVILFGCFPFPILLALLFNELKDNFLKRFTQTISYLPYFLSWISVVALLLNFFSLDGTFNDIRKLILGSEIEGFNPLMDADYFLPLLFISHLWKNIGWASVIFLAAISGIDSQLYEASTMDGCTRFQQIIYITLPGIMPTALIILILSSGMLVTSNFEQVFGLQNLYTLERTDIIGTIVYRKGILSGEYSMATAFGLAQGLCSFIIVLVSNKITSKFSGQSIL